MGRLQGLAVTAATVLATVGLAIPAQAAPQPDKSNFVAAGCSSPCAWLLVSSSDAWVRSSACASGCARYWVQPGTWVPMSRPWAIVDAGTKARWLPYGSYRYGPKSLLAGNAWQLKARPAS